MFELIRVELPLVRAKLPLMTILAASGCSSFGAGAGDGVATSESSAEVTPLVSVPSERLTPFCEAMSDLSARLADAGEADDTRQLIIDAYTQIVDDVPPVIAADFNAVLASLRTGAPIPTAADSTDQVTDQSSDQSSGVTAESQSGDTATLAEEGTLPGATPGERIQDYVNFTCLGTANNPGPPATSPP